MGQHVTSVLLVDAENVIGPSKPRLPLVRARVQALLAAAGPVDHAVACFSQSWPADDSVTSALIELGVVPWAVPACPDAAELALIGHARYLATRGRPWRFLVASGDHRLAEIGEYGELHVLVWDGHPLAGRLTSTAAAVHRLSRPTLGTAQPDPVNLTTATTTADNGAAKAAAAPPAREWGTRLATAILTGVGIGLGQRLVDAALARRGR